MLPRRGPDAFERFIEALMKCDQQKFIAEELTTADDGTDNQSSKSDDDIIREVSGCISTVFSWDGINS